MAAAEFVASPQSLDFVLSMGGEAVLADGVLFIDATEQQQLLSDHSVAWGQIDPRGQIGTIVWGQGKTIVWGQIDPIVWGQTDTIVWGQDQRIWGQNDTIVWGQNSAAEWTSDSPD